MTKIMTVSHCILDGADLVSAQQRAKPLVDCVVPNCEAKGVKPRREVGETHVPKKEVVGSQRGYLIRCPCRAGNPPFKNRGL